MIPLTDAVRCRRPADDVLIVDAHAHAGPVPWFFIPDSDPASMVRVMDRCGVAQALLASCLAIHCDARSGNEVTAHAVEEFPDRLRGYVTVNPWQDPLGELERWVGDPRFVGVKVHPWLHKYPVRGPRYQPVWEFAERTSAFVLAHTDPAPEAPAFVGALGHVAAEHPSVTFLAGHAGYAGTGYDEAITVAERCPNVLLEICGSHFRRPILHRMVERLGAGRVVFGSDFPYVDLRFSLGRVIFSAATNKDQAAILGGTMAELLNSVGARRV